eukprot:TRINITY_DN6843_c8_g1_i1.p1 TRINITY_DN6843_c8_g1~~TRINITY_DN6843_c8_g1_i1.p1  ORF type:complete len:1437 (+),score=399.66 TRINITY_DN6843_c8_g1_i1:114-4424(+)
MAQQPLLAKQGDAGERRVQLGGSEGVAGAPDKGTKDDPFTDNVVTTSKYNLIPAHPKFIIWRNLFEQFHRYANVYFLVVATLQLIPGLSPTGRFTTIIPLSMVLLVTMIKDGYEDYKRHVRDREVNNQRVAVWRGGSWKDVTWKDVMVGDYCKVDRDVCAEFPADLLLLWSNEPQFLCQIETSNLDGETNLKLRKAHTEPPSASGQPFDPGPEEVPWQQRMKALDPSKFRGTIVCQKPNKDLYSFEGKLIREVPGQSQPNTSAIDVVSILLRGSRLGGCTKVVIGCALYTGAQSKLMMNQQKARHKASQLEVGTNKQIRFICCLQLLLCTFCAIGLGVTVSKFSDHWYVGEGVGAPAFEALKGTATFLILFNNLIPISLYVSMEMVKILQAKLMDNDLEMYHEESDTPTEAKTSSLNEELGQVQYVFSDKTGTLTCNIMDFLKFSVGLTSYGTGTTEIGRAAAAREGKVLTDDRPKGIKNVKGFYFYDPRISDVNNTKDWNWTREPNAEALGHFFKVLAVCHTVVVEEDEEEGQPVRKYQAASPDEQCLVSGAKWLGVEFIERNTTDVIIHCYDQGNGQPREERWGLHEVLEFNSDRKRMSIIVTDPRGKLLLLCKGADTVIYERLKQSEPGGPREELLTKTKDFLKKFAADGLRTLCIAQTELDPKFYGDGVQDQSSWQYRYKQAKEAVGGREEKVAACAEEIEKDLELIGTTAIEDKLQMGVPASIELLRCAGVNVWVLTGDKQETAMNIGFACALLHNSMGLYKFEEGLELPELSRMIVQYAQDAEAARRKNPERDLAVIVQGSTLKMITSDEAPPENKTTFLGLAEHCKAVICCRVTPGQKAEVVRLVKEGLGKVTLSIGDGANDVAMITEAHVGIGISGLEGLQAARAADYAIGQFRFLSSLLLIHGRWNYRRMCKVIVYSFYKNILLYLTQFWFCLFNAFTGQSLYDRWAIAGYNVGFTAFPIMAIGLFDRDIDKRRIMSLEQFPELYDAGRNSMFFGTKVFWGYTATAIFQSMVCFFVPMLTLSYTESADSSSGRCIEMHWTGITAYTAVIWVVTLKVALETVSWTKYNHFATWGSLGMWYFFIIVYGEIWSFVLEMGEDWHKMYIFVLSDFKHWSAVFLAVTVSLYRDVCWKFAQRAFKPTLLHKVQRWEAFIREERHGLKDFNYRMMQRQHPELIPRERQLGVPPGDGDDEPAVPLKEDPPLPPPQTGYQPAPVEANGGQGNAVPMPGPGPVTSLSPLQPPADRSRGMQVYHSGPADVSSIDQSHHSPWPHPQHPVGYPYSQHSPHSGRIRRAPPGHPPGTKFVTRYAGNVGDETGFSFSQAEGNQVEIIAARSSGARWAQGFGRLPSPRAQAHAPGTMAIGGMVDSHPDDVRMSAGYRSVPPHRSVGRPLSPTFSGAPSSQRVHGSPHGSPYASPTRGPDYQIQHY